MKLQNVRDWLKDEVTIDFFSRIKLLRDVEDAKVHEALAKSDYKEAANANAAVYVYEEVKDLPNIMEEDLDEGE